jgi:hypothetical protein
LLRTFSVCLLLAAASNAYSQAASPVPLYLATAAEAGGFTDPDKSRTDSVKNREEAVIVLEVLSRGVREDSGSFSKAFGGKNEVKIVRVKLSVGEFSAELSGESAGGGMKGGPGRGAWTKAAYKVADQVDKWVVENAGLLSEAVAAKSAHAQIQ